VVRYCREESGDTKFVYFAALINFSQEILKNCTFKPFYGLDWVTVKLFNKKVKET